MKTILSISGMHCASCTSTISEYLKRLDGVASAQVNLATQTAVVEHDSSITPSDLIASVKQAGYQASIRQTRDKDEVLAQPSFPHLAVWSAVILLIISMGPMVGLAIDENLYTISLQAILSIVIVIASWQVIASGVRAVFVQHKANMDTLVVLGVFAALAYSLYSYITHYVLATSTTSAVYFEVAGLVLAFVLIGRYFEEKAKTGTRDVLTGLLSLRPDTALLLVDKQEKELPVDEITKGDVLKVKPGDRIPVDGVVIAGNTRIDESMLTGEPSPVKKKKDSDVFAGTLNVNGMILVRATSTGKETALARIVQLVQDAQASTAPIQRIADKVAAVFVPVVLVFSVLTFATWMMLAPVGVENLIEFSLLNAIAVLVIACPCALGLATPTAIMVGLGAAGKKGVLFKDASALEVLAAIDVAAFDKTKTLTLGKPQVESIKTYDLSKQVVFRYAASLESASSHPLASAIVSFADKHNISYGDPRSFEEFEGKGVVGKVEGRKIVLGSLDFFIQQNIGIFDARKVIKQFAKKQHSPVLVAVEGKLAAIIGIADPIKDSAADGLAMLNEQGIDSVLLTGDRQEVADVVAKELGIGVVRAQLTPAQKLEEIATLRKKHVLAMVGDGINDAPALAKADVGVAIGAASDVAIEAADVVLVGDEVTGVSRAVHIARRTRSIIRQNLGWAFAYNVVAIPIAAGLLYPFTGWLLSPIIASVAMAFSSLSVVLNSLRLKKIDMEVK